ncbi:MAG: hypothetical protein JRM80_06935, partial [Nitrososphaerota archaeon]|nr:hypothetical protein [Nitrososphaerota archaeon]
TFNLGEWDARETEYELGLGVSLGANTVRIFIDFESSLEAGMALDWTTDCRSHLKSVKNSYAPFRSVTST